MGNPLRVLIVEDSQDDAELLLRELGRGGYEVSCERVDTRDSMEQALAQRTWDLVVGDYSMPHFSGLDALQALRAKGLDIPFIFVSGTIGEDIAVTALKQGARLRHEGQFEAAPACRSARTRRGRKAQRARATRTARTAP
jgi:CheY-like chemotaxis protein